MIPLYRPLIHPAARAGAERVMAGRWTTLGPETEAFEAEFAAFTDAARCVATNNCTSSLQLALAVLDLPPGSLVATTPITFVATALAIVRAGLVPVYVDVDPRTGQMDMDCLAALLAVGLAIGAVVPVHYMGSPPDMAALERLQARYGFAIVEDCAHGPLVFYDDCDGVRRHAGTRNIGCFSFHTLKPLSCGDGGAVTLSDFERYRRLRRLRWYGAISTADREQQQRYSWDYGIEELGFKAYMNDITAAIARGQMPYLLAERQRRAKQWRSYAAELDADFLSVVPHEEGSSFYLCVVQVAPEARQAIIAGLAERGIHASVHYKPINDYPGVGGPGETPAARRFFDGILSLPLHHNLADEEIEQVIAATNSVSRALHPRRPPARA